MRAGRRWSPVAIETPQINRADVAPLLAGQPDPDGDFITGDLLVVLRKALGEINY